MCGHVTSLVFRINLTKVLSENQIFEYTPYIVAKQQNGEITEICDGIV